MPRPKNEENTETLSIKISEKLSEAIRKKAFKANVSKSEYVRTLIQREAGKRG